MRTCSVQPPANSNRRWQNNTVLPEVDLPTNAGPGVTAWHAENPGAMSTPTAFRAGRRLVDDRTTCAPSKLQVRFADLLLLWSRCSRGGRRCTVAMRTR